MVLQNGVSAVQNGIILDEKEGKILLTEDIKEFLFNSLTKDQVNIIAGYLAIKDTPPPRDAIKLKIEIIKGMQY